MRDLRRRDFLAGAMAGMASLAASSSLAADDDTNRKKWPVGHHFWNWDRAWDTGEFLDKRLELTRQTGYEGFEAKPHQIGQPAEVVREKCVRLGIQCVAIGGGLKQGIDYAYAAGAKIVRSEVPKNETKRWVDYAGERGIIIVIHPHVGQAGKPGTVETEKICCGISTSGPAFLPVPTPDTSLSVVRTRCRRFATLASDVGTFISRTSGLTWLEKERVRARSSAIWAPALWI